MRTLKDNLMKRIKALEIPSLAPKVSSAWIGTVKQFGPFEYLKFLPEGSAGRKLAALSNDFKWPGNNDIKTRGSDLTTVDLQAAMSRWFFHTNLVTALNSKADELILSARHRLEITEVISQVTGLIPASNMTSPSIDTIDIGRLSALLAKMRTCITSNIHELCAFRLCSERISETFGEGNELLLGDLGTQISDLSDRTQEAAQEYQRALGGLRSQPLPPDTEWPPDVCEIDFDAIEERGKTEGGTIACRLRAFARAEMLIAFGQTTQAFEKLKPYLGTTDAEDPKEE
jgi:hypothetical protein